MQGRAKSVSVTFTEHARLQLKERNISETSVRKCVAKPDKITFQKNNRACAAKRKSDHHILIVIYEQESASIKVVTAFITSKAKKYL